MLPTIVFGLLAARPILAVAGLVVIRNKVTQTLPWRLVASPFIAAPLLLDTSTLLATYVARPKFRRLLDERLILARPSVLHTLTAPCQNISPSSAASILPDGLVTIRPVSVVRRATTTVVVARPVILTIRHNACLAVVPPTISVLRPLVAVDSVVATRATFKTAYVYLLGHTEWPVMLGPRPKPHTVANNVVPVIRHTYKVPGLRPYNATKALRLRPFDVDTVVSPEGRPARRLTASQAAPSSLARLSKVLLAALIALQVLRPRR